MIPHTEEECDCCEEALEWKRQHENALASWNADVANMNLRIVELQNDATKLRKALLKVADAVTEGQGWHDENETGGLEDCQTDECNCEFVWEINNVLNDTVKYR
jgi:hypothetical protein